MATFIFAATTPATGTELYVTDGTTAGTTLVKDIFTGAGNGVFGGFVSIGGGRALFSANDGTNGFEPWVTDGTAAGTVLLRNVAAGGGNSNPFGFFGLGNNTGVFGANPGTGNQLFATDGTSANTTLIKDFGVGGFTFGFAQVLTGKAVFTGADGAGFELWTTDGTSGGTTLLKDINPGAGNSVPLGQTSLGNGKVVFSADDGTNGRELWVTDGTSAGTTFVKDIQLGAGGSNPFGFTVAGTGKALFTATTAGSGAELWITDGTAAGTNIVKDIRPGANNSFPAEFTALSDDRFVFSADDGTNGNELWVTDGTTGGTTLVRNINPAAATGSVPFGFESLGNGKVLFNANDGTNGSELWVTDGTLAGTTLVLNINAGAAASNPTEITAVGGGRAIFTATDASGGRELWTSDGTAAGTTQLKDIVTGVNGSNPFGMTELPPANLPPVITSNGGGATAALTVTGGTTAVTTVVATDANGTTPTYAIQGGADAAKFTINATSGALAFAAAPNFATPTDAGANNVYDVIVRATDGTANDDQALAVTVTAPAAVDKAGTIRLSGLDEAGNANGATPVFARVTDPDGNPTSVVYTFSENGTVVKTGSSNSYTPSYDESGKALSVSAAYTDGKGNSSTISASAGTVQGGEKPLKVSDLLSKPSSETLKELVDYDGNKLGGVDAWKILGQVDVQGDGDLEFVLVNKELGRWATLGPDPKGIIDLENHGQAGDTRVVGIYIDPLIALGKVVAGSDFDSQKRFMNDLKIDNIGKILGAGDYDSDGLQEIYFDLNDDTAVLHAYMHADGNIQYANYQTEDQARAYLTSNGVSDTFIV